MNIDWIGFHGKIKKSPKIQKLLANKECLKTHSITKLLKDFNFDADALFCRNAPYDLIKIVNIFPDMPGAYSLFSTESLGHGFGKVLLAYEFTDERIFEFFKKETSFSALCGIIEEIKEKFIAGNQKPRIERKHFCDFYKYLKFIDDLERLSEREKKAAENPITKKWFTEFFDLPAKS